MAKENDKLRLHELLEPFWRVINSNPPKDKPASTCSTADRTPSLKERISILLAGSKRKSSVSHDVSTPGKLVRTGSDSSIKSAPPPPDLSEVKRLKADLIAAKAEVTELEVRINQQHTTYNEFQIKLEAERASLQEQHKKDERAMSDMKDQLSMMQRSGQELKDDYEQDVMQHKKAKAQWDKEKIDLYKQIGDLKDKLLEADVSNKEEFSQLKKNYEELLQTHVGAQSEVEMLKEEVSKLTSRAEQSTSLQIQLEKQTLELQQVTSKLKELEFERDSYKDWQNQAKTAEKRLSNMVELEKEVVRLRSTERSLRDGIYNTLLLEEQVHQLTLRLNVLQSVQQELQQAKVKLATVEAQLEEWQRTAYAHDVETAQAMSTVLESAFDSQLAATAASSQALTQLAQLTEEVATLKYERDNATGKVNDLQTVRESHKSIIHRLWKRLLLITKERDTYRYQLGCYQKELTVTLSGEEGAGSAALMAGRIEQLEESLQSYRELLASTDPAQQATALDSLRAEVTKWREEAESARRDAQKMRSQRDSLQMHLERISNTFAPQTKIVRLVDEPVAEAQKQVLQDFESGQEEIKRLTAALREGSSNVCPEESQQLRQQLENNLIKLGSETNDQSPSLNPDKY